MERSSIFHAQYVDHLSQNLNSFKVIRNIIVFLMNFFVLLDACTLAVFMAQLMKFKLDEVTTIKLAFSMLSFVDKAFLLNRITWPDESNVHNCRTNLLTFTITILYSCSKIDLNKVRSRLTADECPTSRIWRKLDHQFWGEIKRKQFNALRSGIRFLSFLAKRDPDFFVRASDVDDLFQLFMQQVTMIEDFALHENERKCQS